MKLFPERIADRLIMNVLVAIMDVTIRRKGDKIMTFNCRFETPCGWCEKFDKECKEVCSKPKSDRFKPQNNNNPTEFVEKLRFQPHQSLTK